MDPAELAPYALAVAAGGSFFLAVLSWGRKDASAQTKAASSLTETAMTLVKAKDAENTELREKLAETVTAVEQLRAQLRAAGMVPAA